MLKRTKAEIADVLGAIPLFAGLSKRQLRALAGVCSDVQYEPGVTILAQQDTAQHMAVVVAGKAAVVRDGKRLAMVGPGDAVGEMALIDGSRRSASVVAETSVDALLIYATDFRKLLTQEPTMCAKLLLAQTARLRELDRRVALLG